jgi:hypothetical protein
VSTLDHKRLLAEVAALRQRLADCAVESMAAAAEPDERSPGAAAAQHLAAWDCVHELHLLRYPSTWGCPRKHLPWLR